MGQVFKKVRGTTSDRFAIGNAVSGDKFLEADNNATNLPHIKWNDTLKRWECADETGVDVPIVATFVHKSLYDLIHFIDDGPADGFASGAYKETLPAASPFPTSFIWWTSAAKTQKLVELALTLNANKTPATEVWKMYDAAGALALTLTDTITYSGVFETSRTRTWV